MWGDKNLIFATKIMSLTNTVKTGENKRLVRTAQWRKMIITDETKSYNL